MGGRLAGIIGLGCLLFSGMLPAFAYEGVEVENGGGVVGIVKVTGLVGEPVRVPVTRNREVCGEDVADESLEAGPGGGLRNAVVTLEGVARGKPAEREAVNALDNRGCRFAPRVQVASTGQWLELTNSDPILHNAYAAVADSKVLFNVALWPGRRLRKPLAYPGVVRITCGARHPWMRAYVVVTEHPYHAVTDLYGAYEIGDIPAGSYKVAVWHELLGEQRKEVRTESGKTIEVDFDLAVSERLKKERRAAPPAAGREAAAPAPAPVVPPQVTEGAPSAKKGAGVVKASVSVRGEAGAEVQNVVISVEGVPVALVPREKMEREKRAVIVQKDMRFVPRVLPVLVGTTVDFPNNDPVYHNVFSVSPAKKFDLGLYPQGETRSATFDGAGVVEIGCNVHHEMEAYVVVKDHPFFTVPNRRGIGMLDDVPLGSYTLSVWHPKLGTLSRPFTLERDGEVLSMDFDLGRAK